jgi:hypothetical protein
MSTAASMYTYIFMIHYKLLILILSTCKYVTSYHLSLLKNISKNLMSMSHHLSLLKNNSKKIKKIISWHVTFLN